MAVLIARWLYWLQLIFGRKAVGDRLHFMCDRGFIYDTIVHMHGTTITMIKLWSDLHSRTTTHIAPLRASYGVSFVSYANKNACDISRAHCIRHAYHRNEKVVRMTALIFTGDVEDKLQRLQWIPRLSTWRPFRFCVYLICLLWPQSCQLRFRSDDYIQNDQRDLVIYHSTNMNE